jgi:hypothetical protein
MPSALNLLAFYFPLFFVLRIYCGIGPERMVYGGQIPALIPPWNPLRIVAQSLASAGFFLGPFP